MKTDGMAKLLEELGELSQIIAKKLAYSHTDEHPDGKGSMKARITEEMGDVKAAMYFVAEKLGIDHNDIQDRATMKYGLYLDWDKNGEI